MRGAKIIFPEREEEKLGVVCDEDEVGERDRVSTAQLMERQIRIG